MPTTGPWQSVETRHDQIDDYTEVHAGHSTIMSNREVIDETVAWLNARRSGNC